MVVITFTVPGNPVAKGRARAFIRGRHVGHYTPEKTANYENLVKLAAVDGMKGKQMIVGPAGVVIDLFFQIPASWSKKKKAAALNGEVRPTVKPDCSNVLKSIEDALNGIVWADDKQAVDVSVKKYYSDKPRAIVSVIDI